MLLIKVLHVKGVCKLVTIGDKGRGSENPNFAVTALLKAPVVCILENEIK